MSTKETEHFRKVLRHAIYEEFPNINPKDIYNALKKKNSSSLFFDDLLPICYKSKIPIEQLHNIFQSYQVYADYILPEKFVTFLEDESTLITRSTQSSSSLTSMQKDILSKFIQSIQGRRTQATPPFTTGDYSANSYSTERKLLSYLWIFIQKYNPPGSNSSEIRVSAFLKLIKEMNLSIDFDAFLDALFAFFNGPLEQLDFTQFARFVDQFA